jgi:hypothetical protein
VSRRDQTALAALIERHGPIVQRGPSRSWVTTTTPRTPSRPRSWSWLDTQAQFAIAAHWRAG